MWKLFKGYSIPGEIGNLGTALKWRRTFNRITQKGQLGLLKLKADIWLLCCISVQSIVLLMCPCPVCRPAVSEETSGQQRSRVPVSTLFGVTSLTDWTRKQLSGLKSRGLCLKERNVLSGKKTQQQQPEERGLTINTGWENVYTGGNSILKH